MQSKHNRLGFYVGMFLIILVSMAFLLALPAQGAQTVPSPALQAAAPGQTCFEYTVLTASLMSTSPSFGINQLKNKAERPLVDVIVKLTDANSSITRFDSTCTVSTDGNTTDVTPQSLSVSGGVATQTDGLTYQKASPGSVNFLVSFDLKSMPDFECTFAVGAGSAAAADIVTVIVRECAR